MVSEDATDRVTTGLDVLAILAVVVGVTGGLWPWLGWFALAVGGLLLAAASQVVVRVSS